MTFNQIETKKIRFVKSLNLEFNNDYDRYLKEAEGILVRLYGEDLGTTTYYDCEHVIDSVWNEQEMDHAA